MIKKIDKKENRILISPRLLTLMSSIKIPLHIFHEDRLTPMEAIIKFLKEEHSLNYHEISLLINRNERNVWTIYHNATSKIILKSNFRGKTK